MAIIRVSLLSWAIILTSHQIAQALISQDKLGAGYIQCIRRAGESLKEFPETKDSDASLEWSCMQAYLWETASERMVHKNLTQQQEDFLTALMGDPGSTKAWDKLNPRTLESTGGKFARSKRNDHNILKRSVANVPRKEYRALTNAERTAVHIALNKAKTSTLLPCNVYDFVASLHSGVLAAGAHGGPAFLGFHRIYILLMDLVISYFDDTNSVRLPYFDNTLDNELPNPSQSIMWHSSFAGQGNGFVNNGPFGSWATLHGPSLIRSIGSGSLMSKSDVDNVLTRLHLVEISQPTAAAPYNLESHHGRVHGWIGGDMGSLATATNDPVFFMHHAFIDCIWERFRNRQQSLSINPNTDYPGTLQLNNKPGDSIGIVPFITNSGAGTAFWASLATCEWPQCPSCGNSQYLRCNSNKRCVPVLSDEYGQCPSCSGDNQNGYNGYQNSYCVNANGNCENSNCDTSEWALVPVQITYNRPPDYEARGRYGSYPVVKGRAQTYDIYSPRSYGGPIGQTYEAQSQSSRYRNCGCRENSAGSGQVYIQSYGLNYDGNYKEYSVVDRRYAISSNLGYVAVKNPRAGATQAYVSVYDDCGRLCRPTCWDSRTRSWVACSGAVYVTSDGGSYKGYGNTYEEATYQVYDYGAERRNVYPTYSPNNVYLNYVCEYSGNYPWNTYR